MTRRVSAYEARTKLGELMNLVYYRGIEVIVEKMGRPMVKLTRVDESIEKETKTKDDILSLAGVWENKSGEIIEENVKKLRKKSKFIPS